MEEIEPKDFQLYVESLLSGIDEDERIELYKYENDEGYTEIEIILFDMSEVKKKQEFYAVL